MFWLILKAVSLGFHYVWLQHLGFLTGTKIRPDELQITTAGANVVEVQSANNEAYESHFRFVSPAFPANFDCFVAKLWLRRDL